MYDCYGSLIPNDDTKVKGFSKTVDWYGMFFHLICLVFSHWKDYDKI